MRKEKKRKINWRVVVPIIIFFVVVASVWNYKRVNANITTVESAESYNYTEEYVPEQTYFTLRKDGAPDGIEYSFGEPSSEITYDKNKNKWFRVVMPFSAFNNSEDNNKPVRLHLYTKMKLLVDGDVFYPLGPSYLDERNDLNENTKDELMAGERTKGNVIFEVLLEEGGHEEKNMKDYQIYLTNKDGDKLWKTLITDEDTASKLENSSL